MNPLTALGCLFLSYQRNLTNGGLLMISEKSMNPSSSWAPYTLGVPNPACIPKDWPLLVIDLKDCFITIPLAEKNWEHFAFSLPVINNSQPLQQFQWRVLPQGMLNSPTICQHFIHSYSASKRSVS